MNYPFCNGPIIGLFEDDRKSHLIGIGQCGTLHPGKVQMVKLVALPVDVEHYVPETFVGAPLVEKHAVKCDQ